MPSLIIPKIDMKAALAKVGGDGIAKSLQGPLQERLQPGLKWHRGFVDAFAGAIPDVVRAFTEGIFTVDAERKWDDADERPREDRFAWIRAIRSTGVTAEGMYEGGEWVNLDGSAKVQTWWSKGKGRLCFALEIAHLDGAQVVLKKPGGPLIEVRGREVIHLNWAMPLGVKASKNTYTTVLGGLIQSEVIKGCLASAPSFNYDITTLSDCIGILAARMEYGLPKLAALRLAIINELLPHRPIYLLDEDMVKEGAITEHDWKDIDWLLAPYGLALTASKDLRLDLQEVANERGNIAPAKTTKKNSYPTQPLEKCGVVHRLLAGQGFFSHGVSLGLYGHETAKGLDFREIALQGRYYLSDGELDELGGMLFHRAIREMKQIKASEIPAPTSKKTVEEDLSLPSRPGGWNLVTIRTKHNSPDKNAPSTPSTELPKAAGAAPAEEKHVLNIAVPAATELLAEPPGGSLVAGEDFDRVVREVQGLVGRVKTAERDAAAAKSLLAAKEAELQVVLVSLESAQARKIELTEASQAELQAKDDELRELHGRVLELDGTVTRLTGELEALRAKEQTPDAPEPISNVILVDEDDSTVSLGTIPSDQATDEDLSAELVPAYFARFTVPMPLDEVIGLYEQWFLGMGPYNRIKRNRVNQNGIDPEWGLQDLHGEVVDLKSEEGAEITLRRNGRHSLARYRHLDAAKGGGMVPGTTWTNLARFTETDDGGCLVEHGVVRASEEGAKRPGYTPVPAVVRDLLRKAIPGRPWEAFSEKAWAFSDDNVKDLVRNLLSPDRDVPMVVVASRRGEVLVDADGLAKDWFGLATVHVDQTRAPRALSDALAAAGATTEKLGCWDGAIRIYYPGFSPLSDFYEHPLFTRNTLGKWTTIDVSRRIGRKIALRSIPERAPRGFFSLIEQFDVDAAQAKVAALEGTEGTELREAMESQVRALEAALAQREREIEGLARKASEAQKYEEVLAQFQSDYDERGAQINRLNSHLRDANSRVQTLEAALEGASASARAGMVPAACLFDLLAGDRNEIGTSVRMIQELYSDRIMFLPGAVKGAEESEFQHPDQAVKIIWSLATDYWDGLQTGGGDPGPRVFGVKGYASKETEQLTADGRKARTFTVNGKRVLMEQHLKLGRGHSWTSDREVFRIYFAWVPRENKIYVGHIGRHLPL